MVIYEHRQRAPWLVALLGGFGLLAAVLAATIAGAHLVVVLATAGAALLVAAFLFGSLSVRVSADEIRASFRPGWVRRRIAVSTVVSAETVRNRWYYGWGVRLTPTGWMFNVSGLDAVLVRLADGRAFRIGTDEPEALLVAIQSVTRRPS